MCVKNLNAEFSFGRKKIIYKTTSFKSHKMRVKFLSPKVNVIEDIKSITYKDTNIYQIIKTLQTTTIFFLFLFSQMQLPLYLNNATQKM